MKIDKSLSAITKYISRGITPKYDDEGYRVVNQRCIRNHRINYNLARFSNREKTRIKQDKFIQRWDVLVNSTGVGTLGRVAQTSQSINDVTVDSHVTIIRPNLEVLDGRYFGYSLIFRENFIKTLGIGSTGQTELSRQRISEVTIPVYPLPIQRKITSILSPFDDLINNNLERIKILVEMAQIVFHEWFVNLKFPEYEKIEILETEEGFTPEGWKYEPLGKISKITMGQSPKSIFYNEIGTGLPFHQGVTKFGDIYPDTVKYSTEGKRLAKHADILFSVRAPVGRMNIANTTMILGRGLCGIRDNENHQYFLYHQLKQFFYKEDIMGSGTIFKAVTKSDMNNLKILVPDKELIDKFEKIAVAYYSLIENLTIKNRILLECRDILLPKLISGEIDISEIEIAV